MPSLLKVKRHALGLTQRQLAYKLRITGAAVSDWERGNSWPGPSLIPKLARIFKMKPEDFSRELETARLAEPASA
jgi:transcriptional regulator with XRE-family HTH domain